MIRGKRPEGERGVSGRLLRGFMALGVGVVSRVLVQFLQVPLFLFYWAGARYGEWLILFAVPSYLMLTDLGVGAAGGIAIAHALSVRDLSYARSLYVATRLMITLACACLLVILFVSVFFWHVEQHFHFHQIVGMELSRTLFGVGLYVILCLQMECSFSLLRGVGRYPGQMIAQAVAGVLELAGSAAALLITARADWVVGGMLLARLIVWVGLEIHLRAAAPEFRRPRLQGVGRAIRHLIRPALGFTTFPLVNAIKIQGATLVVGIVFGPVALAGFNTSRILSRFVDLVTQPANFLNAEISYLNGPDKLTQVRRLHRTFMAASISISIVIAVAVYFIASVGYGSWTQGELKFEPIILLLLLFSGIFRVAATVSQNVVAGLNKHLAVGIMNLCAASVGIAISLVIGTLTHQINLVMLVYVLMEMVYFITFANQAIASSDDEFSIFFSTVLNASTLSEGAAFLRRQVDRYRRAV